MVVNQVCYGGTCGKERAGNMQFIDGIMGMTVYFEILTKNIKQSAGKLGVLSTYVFQQDNDPKHKADIIKIWFIWNVPKQLKPPPQSVDLNSIEYLLAFFKPRIYCRNPSSKEDLKRVVYQKLSIISPQCHRLVCSVQLK